MKLKKRCNKFHTIAAIPLLMGVAIILVGMMSLLVPVIVSLFSGVDPDVYIRAGEYVLLGDYESLISFISLGLMLIVFGIVLGALVVSVVEPVVKHLHKA